MMRALDRVTKSDGQTSACGVQGTDMGSLIVTVLERARSAHYARVEWLAMDKRAKLNGRDGFIEWR